ncbi:ATP-dependent DNA helicase RecG [bacterium]|jgi:ATP-dependent DNA helicase RecG|nr:ATP-dependent DNA helicase RecG [bacterium]
MEVHLSTPIEKLTRVGNVTANRLANLGIGNVKDLLLHYPVRYEDYSNILATNALAENQLGTIFGTIKSIETKKTPRKRMKITEANLADNYGEIKIIWFNQPYIAENLHENDTIAVAGKVERDFTGWLIKNPSYEKITDPKNAIHTSRLVPIYPLTSGLTQKQVRFLIGQSLQASNEMRDIIPAEIQQKANLAGKITAIQNIHLPSSESKYLEAVHRLKFEELFLIQLLTEQSRKNLKKEKAPQIPFNEQATINLTTSLPFTLTNDQKKAAWQIIQDMEKPVPMNRLMQGEVGSGKTIVAAIAALNAAESGFQTALMAPTEILALQHYETISKLFPNRAIALLTSKHARLSTVANHEIAAVASTLPRNDIKEAIARGKVDIIIGTHAIIQNDTLFSRLGLIIIDEQHRFGVKQRKTLKDKSKNDVPHLLSMTATPIPRSLALTLYGDLDITTIKEMPKNRKPIQTRLVEEKNRTKAYEFIKQKISQNRQVFVICPIIEESDILGVKSATKEFEKLNKHIFPNIKTGLLHGKLKPQEKDSRMQSFKSKDIKILVATAVVEVGVDVPNASIMMIEGSDRFGLSQLHQFRGRVGRGEHQSYCFLFTDSKSTQTNQRLQLFVSARDGFEIAELDLSLRGAGNMYGTEQSGHLENLKLATLADSNLISETKKYAQALLKLDSNLNNHPELKNEISKLTSTFHLE